MLGKMYINGELIGDITNIEVNATMDFEEETTEPTETTTEYELRHNDNFTFKAFKEGWRAKYV